GNGTFDVGTETVYDDVPVGVCNDKNENGVCDLNSGEFIVGVSTNPDAGNGAWDNAGTAYARLNRLLFFSRTDLSPRVYKVSAGACTSTLVDNAYMTVTMGGATRAFLQFCVRDGNVNADSSGGNPLMSGSTITATTTSSTFSAAVDNSPIPAVVGGPTMHTMLIQNTSTATPPVAITAGKADIKFTMGGSIITLPNAVTVNP
ncbi:hypothetical protein, partial [Aquabacterium sp.]|uniref:hypothetical protein n=1 Tax=Aquabacterium sp. TaxID=1872578 RepID=UPI0025C0829C